MLSWSSTETGQQVDLAAVADGAGDVGLEHGGALLRFASACGGTDDDELAASRAALVAETDVAFMVDAAAVAANFEMMTRLADGTGATLDGRAARSAPRSKSKRWAPPTSSAAASACGTCFRRSASSVRYFLARSSLMCS